MTASSDGQLGREAPAALVESAAIVTLPALEQTARVLGDLLPLLRRLELQVTRQKPPWIYLGSAGASRITVCNPCYRMHHAQDISRRDRRIPMARRAHRDTARRARHPGPQNQENKP